jgi:putative aldouronate transport system permease protein
MTENIKKSNAFLARIGYIRKALRDIRMHKTLYIIIIPALIYLFVFQYIPMYGVVMAFQDF